ncbi:unnamed protein product [Cylindrotheca closterium]|uniref:U-box domain-containing protein n=1 Tax=Cylindrotheca closterium TaxID=2856 RepID=A0AAD2G831_9STRA|nr:unnamed protein product [Cylindrotheca closterium]
MSDIESSSSQVPDGFICPISLELMRDPVMNRRSLSYERKSILNWLHRGNAHCPLTREPLRPSQLVPNNALKVRIRRWSMENGVSHEEHYNNNDDILSDRSESSEEEGSEKYSHIEEMGVMGFMSNNNNYEIPTSSRNALADLTDLFDQVLEITSTD